MHKKTEPLYAIELDRRDLKGIPILVNYGFLSNNMSGPRLFYYRSDARSYARQILEAGAIMEEAARILGCPFL